MFEITLLGTAGSAPTKTRALPSLYLSYEGDSFLFDCGEGTQMQLLKFGLSPHKIRAIFLSHIHGDHVIGVAGLVRTLALNNRTEELKIFIPKGYEKAVVSLIKFDKAIINYPIKILPIQRGVIFKGKDYTISSFKLNHTVETFGFVFKENDKVKFDLKMCKKLGIKGEMFKHLELKNHIIINNKKILLKQVSFKKIGRKIVYSSDTRPCAETLKNSKNADILIHESSYTSKYLELAKSRKHSTVSEAAELAKKAKVKQLILTHFSARYKDDYELINEAKAVFENTVIGKDGYKVTL
jgi:ribonuclease Z